MPDADRRPTASSGTRDLTGSQPVSPASFVSAVGIVRLATIVLLAIIAGVIAGFALATLSEEDTPAGSSSVQSVPADAADGPDGAEALKAVLQPAATPSGKRRQRARVEVTVSLRNLSGRPRPATAEPALLVGADRVHVDSAAADAAGGILKEVPALTSVTGVLRFETAGAVTERLTSRRRARLRISGQTLALKLSIAPAP